MRAQKINLNFIRTKDAELEIKAQHILDCLTNNPEFNIPLPELQQLQAATAAYSQAVAVAAGKDRMDLATKNHYRRLLQQQLAKIGRYIIFVADGNTALLVKSGYPLSKMPSPITLQNPGNVQLRSGITAGQLVAGVKRPIKGRLTYYHEISDMPPAENTRWQSYLSTSSKYVFNNLTPGRQYWVRVAVIGSGTQLAYSPIASIHAQ